MTSSAVRPTILVFTEGEKTEVQYLQAWVRRNREKVLLAIDERHGLSPLDLVRLAVEARKLDRRAERNREGSAFSEIWCVFDVDQHANLRQARDLARGNEIKIALSNPCFELWLVLHDREQQAWISKDDVQSLSHSIFGAGKSLRADIADGLMAHLENAIRRAEQLDRRHRANGSPDGENPSTGMWNLMVLLQS